LALISLLGGITYWISKPPPAPRIVASHQITRDGLEKTRPVSDGARLYFNEVTGRSMMLAQVSVAGGEVSQVATPFVGDPVPYDLSPDKSEILLGEGLLIGGVFPVWVAPLPSGPAHRLPFETSSWATWTHDGKEILFARKNELFLGAKDGTHPRRLLSATGDISRPQISPDAQRIRFGVAGGPGEPASSIWEASIDGSDPHRLFPSHNEPHYSGTWSSDGNHYFFSSRMGPLSNLWVLPEKRPWWKRSSPAPVRLTFGPLSLGREAVTRDNAKLFALAIDARGELSILDEKSKQFVPYLSGVSACEVAFSSDGQWVAYVAYPEGTLWRSRIDGSERMQLTFSPMGIVNPRWSPDGKLIVFTEITRGKMAIYVVPAVGGAPMLTIAGEFSVHEPMWSRDGRSIVYGVCPICEPKAQPALWIYDLKTQQSTKVPGSDGLWSPRWSPDGRYLTAMTIDVQHLMLFRFSTRKWETLGSGFELGWPAWSHDSNYVYIEQHPSRIVRFKVSDHTVEPVTTLEHIRPAVYPYASGGGYTLTPDDRVLLMREIGTWDVYAFDLAFD
jgi:Tol biopolymer transport system component